MGSAGIVNGSLRWCQRITKAFLPVLHSFVFCLSSHVRLRDQNRSTITRCGLQEAKWRADERAEQLGLELEAAMTQRAKQDMEARAAATKADSDLRSAIVAAEGLKVELNGARSQVGVGRVGEEGGVGVYCTCGAWAVALAVCSLSL